MLTQLFWMTVAFTMAFVQTTSFAHWKPSKNVELVAPATPGGGYDTLARKLHKVIQDAKLITTPFNVVNKPGGASGIGWGYVSQHAGDAHFIAVASSTLLTNDIAGINPFKWTDLTPLAVLSTEYLVFSVRAENKFKGAKELMDAVRANPKAAVFATAPGPGNANHIIMGLMAKAIGANVAQMPLVFFSSAGDSMTAALGGHVDVVISSIPPVLEQVKAGKMRTLAVGAPQRLHGVLANVPTLRELGANAVFVNWRGVIGPKDMSKEQIRYWEDLLGAAGKTDAWKSYSEETSSIPTFMDSASSVRFMQTQHSELRVVMQELGLAK
jgi:putative tricarboxylic transport membrane protein